MYKELPVFITLPGNNFDLKKFALLMELVIETPRLLLRKIELADSQAMFELDSDISVHQYLGMKPVTTLAESIAIIQFIHEQYLDHNIGRYAVVEKSTGLFMGWSGLKFIKGPLNEQQNFYELGYRFMPKFWGKGFATEAGLAWINYGITSMKLPEIFAMAASDNFGSRNVLLKCGMEVTGEFELENMPHHWFRISRPHK